jgi:hypothetical protein
LNYYIICHCRCCTFVNNDDIFANFHLLKSHHLRRHIKAATRCPLTANLATTYSTLPSTSTTTTTTMQCFQDCCLFCDRDSPDGPYCSQQCKLADHEKSSSSYPTSPSSPHWHGQAASTHRSSQSSGYGSDSSQYGYSSSDRQLSPSSSRTSLSSTMSSSLGSVNGISPQAKQDLQGFFSSFDQARAAKRRSSTR